jgi:hypothetical protein
MLKYVLLLITSIYTRCYLTSVLELRNVMFVILIETYFILQKHNTENSEDEKHGPIKYPEVLGGSPILYYIYIL